MVSRHACDTSVTVLKAHLLPSNANSSLRQTSFLPQPFHVTTKQLRTRACVPACRAMARYRNCSSTCVPPIDVLMFSSHNHHAIISRPSSAIRYSLIALSSKHRFCIKESNTNRFRTDNTTYSRFTSTTEGTDDQQLSSHTTANRSAYQANSTHQHKDVFATSDHVHIGGLVATLEFRGQSNGDGRHSCNNCKCQQSVLSLADTRC